MKTVQGNLLDMFDNGDFDMIVHGCNCYCNMGGGIAAQIAARYPEAQEADNKTEIGDELKRKLGTIDYVWMSGWLSKLLPSVFKPKIIVNAYTQFHPGADGREECVSLAFAELAADAGRVFPRNAKIGIPAIGCGIAGLLWEDVERIIDYRMGDLDITLVEYVPN